VRVQILLFGQLKEVAGRERDALELPEGARISDLLRRYAEVSPALQPYYDMMAVALNQEYSEAGAALHDGDEVALIPPVSGGSGKESRSPSKVGNEATKKDPGDIALQARSLGPEDPRDDAPLRRTIVGEGVRATNVEIVWQRIDSPEVIARIKRPEDGAVAVFEGIVRNHSRNRRTLYLDYEAYEPMALKELEELAGQARAKFGVREVAAVHRLGRLEIGETSVLIVVAAAHRGAAFDACRWLIDTLKKTVPIWKREHFEDGAVWADGEPFPEEIAKAADKSSALGNKPASK
jgi:MoaE-MoaD fusion protein